MAGSIIDLQRQVLRYLEKNRGRSFTAEELAKALGAEERTESAFKILEHASANRDHRVKKATHTKIYLSQYGIVR